ncbi:four helix bundle protein [Sunxiuqinia indica]|uniref:four helix bundle protein n=1 Tax=Sunxiuqinia indica TaxID=2692584 RepID=UPI00135A330B|nr:four helix bundle protein [Sunxiuqinia indica]
MENRIEKFEDLKIWKEGVNMAVEVYSLLKSCNDFGLRDQIQRSAVSIPSNISEGSDCQSNNEFIRFLKMAKGSCVELRTQLIIANKIYLIENNESLIDRTIILSAMIQKMITYRERIREKGGKVKG